ncbi:unnamed protein product, partial [Didymodactylos carnosus]
MMVVEAMEGVEEGVRVGGELWKDVKFPDDQANRLLAFHSFHLAINNNDTTNGNEKTNDISLIIPIGTLIITQTFFTSSDANDSHSIVYQLNSTLFFNKHSSYELFGLPRYIGINYHDNTSISWNVLKISFCYVLPAIMNNIENDCLNSMLAEDDDKPCSYTLSAKAAPYTHNIRENKWIISVKNDTIC